MPYEIKNIYGEVIVSLSPLDSMVAADLSDLKGGLLETTEDPMTRTRTPDEAAGDRKRIKRLYDRYQPRDHEPTSLRMASKLTLDGNWTLIRYSRAATLRDLPKHLVAEANRLARWLLKLQVLRRAEIRKAGEDAYDEALARFGSPSGITARYDKLVSMTKIARARQKAIYDRMLTAKAKREAALHTVVRP